MKKGRMRKQRLELLFIPAVSCNRTCVVRFGFWACGPSCRPALPNLLVVSSLQCKPDTRAERVRPPEVDEDPYGWRTELVILWRPAVCVVRYVADRLIVSDGWAGPRFNGASREKKPPSICHVCDRLFVINFDIWNPCFVKIRPIVILLLYCEYVLNK